MCLSKLISQHPGQIEDFALYGDAAPNGRFNYVYKAP